MTFILIILLIWYAGIRFAVLHSRRGTVRSKVTVTDWIDEKTSFNFHEHNFQVVFGVENYHTREGVDDPNYVEWLVQLYKTVDDVNTITPLRTHKCDESDYENFYTPTKKTAGYIQRLKERGNMICIDHDQVVSIFGEDDNTDHYRLEFMLIPCQADPSINKVCPYSLQ
jgi:hypothetical protein